jgi:hypothetical protein
MDPLLTQRRLVPPSHLPRSRSLLCALTFDKCAWTVAFINIDTFRTRRCRYHTVGHDSFTLSRSDVVCQQHLGSHHPLAAYSSGSVSPGQSHPCLPIVLRYEDISNL